MSSRLTRIPFTPNLLSFDSVKRFDCGSEPWEREVNDWFHKPEGASAEAAKGNQVWLYSNAAGEMVGVGSFGESKVKWPDKKSPMVRCSMIPWAGVDRRHQRKGLGTEIIDDLISEALAVAKERPLLTLYVNSLSPAARWYREQFNFTEVPPPYLDKATGYTNFRMVLSLNQLIATDSPEKGGQGSG